MKIQKIVGLLIIAISILTLSMQLSLAKLSRYIDETTGEYWSKGYEYKYISGSVYILIPAACAIGIYLIIKSNKDK